MSNNHQCSVQDGINVFIIVTEYEKSAESSQYQAENNQKSAVSRMTESNGLTGRDFSAWSQHLWLLATL